MKKTDWPIGCNQLINPNLNLVFVMSELQPRIEEFDSATIKFVGPCVDESVRASLANKKFDTTQTSQLIKEFLDKSASIGPDGEKVPKKLIYVSMGTVFGSENPGLFKILIEACLEFSKECAIIVSTGNQETYDNCIRMSLNHPDILLMPHAPQIEILKQASLFITHAGMNSVSEAIIYGDPIICLPLSGDQPFVAWRVADELKIGVRLEPNETLTVKKVTNAIRKVLGDKTFKNNVQALSDTSKTYAGHKTACQHIIQFLKDNEAKKKCKISNNLTKCSEVGVDVQINKMKSGSM
jgi:UDP:flavonoid glycosyltransferase YjiC (YdhE family)